MVFFDMLENFLTHARSVNSLQERVVEELGLLNQERKTLLKGLSALADCTPEVYSFNRKSFVTDQTFDILFAAILDGSELRDLNNFLLIAMSEEMPCNELPVSETAFHELPNDYDYSKNFDGNLAKRLDASMLDEFRHFLRDKKEAENKKKEKERVKGKGKEPELPKCWDN
jgi:hypothetical protein